VSRPHERRHCSAPDVGTRPVLTGWLLTGIRVRDSAVVAGDVVDVVAVVTGDVVDVVTDVLAVVTGDVLTVVSHSVGSCNGLVQRLLLLSPARRCSSRCAGWAAGLITTHSVAI